MTLRESSRLLSIELNEERTSHNLVRFDTLLSINLQPLTFSASQDLEAAAHGASELAERVEILQSALNDPDNQPRQQNDSQDDGDNVWSTMLDAQAEVRLRGQTPINQSILLTLSLLCPSDPYQTHRRHYRTGRSPQLSSLHRSVHPSYDSTMRTLCMCRLRGRMVQKQQALYGLSGASAAGIGEVGDNVRIGGCHRGVEEGWAGRRWG